jgi:hypothetical protein
MLEVDKRQWCAVTLPCESLHASHRRWDPSPGSAPEFDIICYIPHLACADRMVKQPHSHVVSHEHVNIRTCMRINLRLGG